MQDSSSQAASLGEGVCGHKKKAASPRIFGGLRSPYPCLKVFDFFFNLNGEFMDVMYIHSQAHTYIMKADQTERVQKEIFFSTKYAA